MGGKPVGATGYIAYYQPSWNDQVSSFQVNGGRGCTLTLYQHAGTWVMRPHWVVQVEC